MKRQRTPSDYGNLAIALAVLAALIGFGVDLIVKGVHAHKAAEIAGGGFLAACGAVVPAVILGKLLQGGLRRAVPGAEPPAFELALDRPRYAPGDQVTGHVKVSRAGRLRKLTVSLRCHDKTLDYSGSSYTPAGVAVASGEVPAPTEYPFTLTLPADAPPSYSDGLAEIWWQVEARADVIGSDVRSVARIDVASGTRVAA